MPVDRSNPRKPTAEVDAIFTDRWSPRSLGGPTLSETELASLFEAARWAPSCYNEQPWQFHYAVGDRARERFATALVDKNRQWAAQAPVLLFVVAHKTFSANGKPNRHAAFDAGAAWMSLALQARRLGLHAHAMAGFSVDKAAEVLGLDLEQVEIMAAVAIGRRASVERLPEDLRPMEVPNNRRPRMEIALLHSS